MTIEERYSELRDLLQKFPSPTAKQLEEERFDFAYGNLAASINHKPSRAAFLWLAQERGWTIERFTKWAEGREWLP